MNRQPRRPLFTIGHSNHSIEHFLALLRRHGVEAIADVRSRPYSRFVPHFGKERLARLLEAEGLGYVFLGRELGGKPLHGDPPQARLDYAARTREPSFRRGIETLLDVLAERHVALMCRERDPLDCHRLHLICRHVRPWPWTFATSCPTGPPRCSRRPNSVSSSGRRSVNSVSSTSLIERLSSVPTTLGGKRDRPEGLFGG